MMVCALHVMAKGRGTRGRPFKFTVEACGKTFTRSDVLKTHVQGFHEDARPFKCTVEGCGTSFTQSSSLKRHVRTVHGGQGTPSETDSFERQIADPPVVVKIEDDQDQIVDTISAPALEFALDQKMKEEQETPQDDARLHFFRRLSGQDRVGARVACEFELENGIMQHFHGIVNGGDPANPGKVDILFDDREQWNGWPVEDVLLVVSLTPSQEAVFQEESSASGAFGPSRGSPKRRLTSGEIDGQDDDELVLSSPTKRLKSSGGPG